MATVVELPVKKPSVPESAEVGSSNVTISAKPGSLTLSLGWFASLTITDPVQYANLVTAIAGEAEVAFPGVVIEGAIMPSGRRA